MLSKLLGACLVLLELGFGLVAFHFASQLGNMKVTDTIAPRILSNLGGTLVRAPL